MSTAEATEVAPAEISELLTWAEICARHPDEWVCLVEMEFTPPNGPEIRTARVIGHGKTRRAPFDQALAWRDHYDLIGHFYTGRVTVRPPRPSLILDDETRDLLRYRR
jgi:hypothetical protein